MNKNYYLIATVLIIIILFPSHANALLSKDCYKDLNPSFRDAQSIYIQLNPNIDETSELEYLNEEYLENKIKEIGFKFSETYDCLKNKHGNVQFLFKKDALPKKDTIVIQAFLDIRKIDREGREGFIKSFTYTVSVINENSRSLFDAYNYSNTDYFNSVLDINHSLYRELGYLSKVPNHTTGQFTRFLQY